MELEEAIRTRRTFKAFRPEPVPRETLDELFELARWAPSHNLTNPWRFRVVGPEALAALKEAAGPESAPKLDRAPTLVVVSAVATGDPVQDEEDMLAVGVASYILLLGAGWRATGARPPSCARRRAGPPSGCRTASASSASCISAGAARRSRRPSGPRPPTS
jgi:nitroreductase